jgi:hypothetical protein
VWRVLILELYIWLRTEAALAISEPALIRNPPDAGPPGAQLGPGKRLNSTSAHNSRVQGLLLNFSSICE